MDDVGNFSHHSPAAVSCEATIKRNDLVAVEAEERESWGQFYFIILLKADVSYHPVCRKTELQLPTSILLGAEANATISIVSI